MSATYLSHVENMLYNMDLCLLPLRPRDSVNSDTLLYFEDKKQFKN